MGALVIAVQLAAQVFAATPASAATIPVGSVEVGTTAAWQVIAYVYCSSVAPGHQIVSNTSTITSGPFNSTQAVCPNGKSGTGSGGLITGGQRQVKLLTHGNGSVGPNRVTAAGLEDITGFSGTWSVTAYEVCVTHANSLDIRLISNQTASDITSPKSSTSPCPGGMRATGGGMDRQPRHAHQDRAQHEHPDLVTTTGRNDTTSSSPWVVYSYVWCAT